MSSSVTLQLVATARDYAVKPAPCGERVGDSFPTTHDLTDQVPQGALATAGAVGSAFVELRYQVVQVERLWGSLGAGADVLFRFGGAAASVLGASGAITLTDGLDIVLAIDGGSPVTVSFLATDNTPALVAKRINYAAGAQVASVDGPTGKLKLDGVRTGDAGAKQRGHSYGAVQVVSGSAVSALGLTVGTTFGSGEDSRKGPGLLIHTFPPGSLPRRIELSGSAPGAQLWVAGTAS